MAKETYSGIYCIEDVWPERGEMSARPLLEAMADFREIHTAHRIATDGERFKARLREWASADMTFAILHLWYHGWPDEVSPSGHESVTLKDIEDELEGHCDKCLVHFGSCKTLKLDEKRIQSFLERTGAVAVSGYTKNVGWIEPVALELIYLDCVQQNMRPGNQRYITESVMRKVSERMKKGDVRKLVKKSGFEIKLRDVARDD